MVGRVLCCAYFLESEIRSAKTTEVGLMISSRVMRMAFKGMRTPRTWRFIPQITGAAGLAAGVSAAVAFPAVPALAQAYASHAPTYSQTITVTTLSNAGTGSLRAAINSANGTSPGKSTLIVFAVHGTITLASALPAIVRQVAIDATTAPTPVTGGPPVVAINCNRYLGLRFAVGSGGSQLLGVAVDNAS